MSLKKTSGVFFPKIETKDTRRLFLLLLLLAASCGRKGPPLPPLRPVPNVVANVSARRIGDRIELRFTLPSANQDGTTPVALGRVDIYARSTPAGSPVPSNDQIIDRENLVGTVSVRPPESDKPPKAGVEPPKDDRPEAGDPALFVDRIPSDPPKPLPPPKRPPGPVPLPPPINPPARPSPPAPPAPPTRYLMLVAVSPKGHAGRPSPLAIPLTPAPPAPHDVGLTYDETTLTIVWQAGIAQQRFRVYDVDAAGHEAVAGLLTQAPLASPTFSVPVEFGKERCVVVRGVELRGNIAIETDAAPPVCKTPVDIFPPPVPVNLDAFADSGFITLTWDSVTAQDLRGYLVLRREGSGDRLQLTPEPITQTAYKDVTVKPGTTYEYAVVAVDQSTPPNRSANSATVTKTAR